jgi:hypothetical protein
MQHRILKAKLPAWASLLALSKINREAGSPESSDAGKSAAG